MSDVPYSIGVHQTHCCLRHGCKYPYKYDSCPVGTEEIKQTYPCDMCLSVDDAYDAMRSALREYRWSLKIYEETKDE